MSVMLRFVVYFLGVLCFPMCRLSFVVGEAFAPLVEYDSVEWPITFRNSDLHSFVRALRNATEN